MPCDFGNARSKGQERAADCRCRQGPLRDLYEDEMFHADDVLANKESVAAPTKPSPRQDPRHEEDHRPGRRGRSHTTRPDPRREIRAMEIAGAARAKSPEQ